MEVLLEKTEGGGQPEVTTSLLFVSSDTHAHTHTANQSHTHPLVLTSCSCLEDVCAENTNDTFSELLFLHSSLPSLRPAAPPNLLKGRNTHLLVLHLSDANEAPYGEEEKEEVGEEVSEMLDLLKIHIG